jgi:hypothetical protein
VAPPLLLLVNPCFRLPFYEQMSPLLVPLRGRIQQIQFKLVARYFLLVYCLKGSRNNVIVLLERISSFKLNLNVLLYVCLKMFYKSDQIDWMDPFSAKSCFSYFLFRKRNKNVTIVLS